MDSKPIQFHWDRFKADANAQKHGVSFNLATSIFHDPRLVTVADLKHSDDEERWISIGCARNGALLSIVYLWSGSDSTSTKIRLISARKASPAEIYQYQEGL